MSSSLFSRFAALAAKVAAPLLLALAPCAAMGQTVNLTPWPYSISVGSGSLVLPENFVVGTAGLPSAMRAEAEKFVKDINKATGLNARTVKKGNALIKCAKAEGIDPEGYKLNVSADGVSVSAQTATGLYYAFQTIKKMLPANVMAGVRDAAVGSYALPTVNIDDKPRFHYRGFMLDVARHFQTVGEVKRMIDMMAAYKLNKFHWHLNDDQGWRVEIKKYPKLTSVGSIAPGNWYVERSGKVVDSKEPYGPYFYTQEQVREVVEYAAERHIEVIPEIDMPGHFVAALASYPEYSCNPGAKKTIWTRGGVSEDVLNVGDPKAVQFAKDILAEICKMFPGSMVHIGGDECPTKAWEGNAQCQALYARLGFKSYSQLQSYFTEEMANFLKKKGKKMAVWNESVTAKGADAAKVAATGATVFCWYPAQEGALQASKLGLNCIITPFGPYYINRKQWADKSEPMAAGYGEDSLKAVYNYVPVPAKVPEEQKKFYVGVQGTFWSEFVGTPDYLEYLALPRLLAIAEAGWTQQADKNFDSFVKRVRLDTKLFDYGHYYYGRHYIDGPMSR